MNPTETSSTQSAAERHNYAHFHPRTLGRDAQLAMQPVGPLPGEPAPDFSLEDLQGRSWAPIIFLLSTGKARWPFAASSLTRRPCTRR